MTVGHTDRGELDRREIAQLVAADIPRGAYVNLGIGQPTLVADYLPIDGGVTLHTENGMLGMGPQAHGDDVDPDLINAGKIPVTETLGASYFHHADSFAMMRGGHLDVCVLGAFQVSAAGDLANWHTGEAGAVPAVGGAMDLAIGAKDVYVNDEPFREGRRVEARPVMHLPADRAGLRRPALHRVRRLRDFTSRSSRHLDVRNQLHRSRGSRRGTAHSGPLNLIYRRGRFAWPVVTNPCILLSARSSSV